MTNKQMAKRIENLELEIKNLKDTIFALSFRQSIVVLPQPAPITPSPLNPWYVQPTVTCSSKCETN